MDISNATVQVRISKQTEFGQYNDAIYLSASEYQAMTQAQIDAMVNERVNSWVLTVQSPSVAVEPTADELINEAAQLQSRLGVLQQKMVDAGLLEEVAVIDIAEMAMQAKVSQGRRLNVVNVIEAVEE